MTIEGVPDGWELVRIGGVEPLGHFINSEGKAEQWNGLQYSIDSVPVIRKIEKPKQYRPFANAEEFRPHRDRWWRFKTDRGDECYPPTYFNNGGSGDETWEQCFEHKVFDDGSPFGVEVAE